MDTTKNQNKVVLGIFRSRADLEGAVSDLKAEGFRNADISALMANNETTKEFATTNETKMPEGASVGTGAGALLGGTLGWLAGIGSLAIPGVGPFVAAGPIMAALAGAGIGAAAGGITGALIGLGIPEYEARRYEGFVKDGGKLLSVHCDSSAWVEKAEKIFKRYNATDVSSGTETSADSDSRVTKQTPQSVGTTGTTVEGTKW